MEINEYESNEEIKFISFSECSSYITIHFVYEQIGRFTGEVFFDAPYNKQIIKCTVGLEITTFSIFKYNDDKFIKLVYRYQH